MIERIETWLESWQGRLQTFLALLAGLAALFALVPKLARRVRLCYSQMSELVSISETLSRMEGAINYRLDSIEDTISLRIGAWRTVLNGDERHVFFEANSRGEYIWANRHWHELTGLTESEAAGRGWENGIDPAQRTEVICRTRHCIENQIGTLGVIRYRDRDGRLSSVRLVVTPVIHPVRGLLGFHGIGEIIPNETPS